MAATAVADVRGRRDDRTVRSKMSVISEPVAKYLTKEQKADLLEEMRTEMKRAAKDLEFERAAELRDEIERLEEKE